MCGSCVPLRLVERCATYCVLIQASAVYIGIGGQVELKKCDFQGRVSEL